MALRILVADDETDIELLITQRFRKEIRDGVFEFVFAENGAVALQRLKQEDEIDLLLADINMPVMDGLTLLERSKAEITRPLKSVVVSAYGDLQNIRQAMNRGAFDFITKPVDFTDLELTIKKAKEELQFIKEALLLSKELDSERSEREKAELREKFKQQFLANMSHEIRTPLNAIIGMTRLLMNDRNNDSAEQYLSGINKSGETLLTIVNDILDLSKIEAGKMELQKIPFSITERVEMVRNMLLVKANEKEIGFEISLDKNIPQTVIGDPHRLNQILINLAGNAIKFTNKGQVSIHCRPLEILNDSCKILFEVKDTGIGMSDEQCEKIFESFTQASADITEKFGGTGLGLSISKQLVELQGGELKVESKVGVGSNFSFTIDYKIVSIESRRNDDTASNEKTIGAIKILLAEDNEFNQLVALGTLKQLAPDAEVEIAENGKVAFEKATSKIYDMILMDVRMPEMDGIETTQLLREKGIQTPIIFMTAGIIEEEVKKCFEAGGNDFVPKPFHPDDLKKKMTALL